MYAIISLCTENTNMSAPMWLEVETAGDIVVQPTHDDEEMDRHNDF